MKRRILFLFSLYVVLLLLFVLQKPLFMLATMPEGMVITVGDILDVMKNALLLDIPVTGYLIALPLLFVIVSLWMPMTIRLRRIATPYYVFVALVVAIIFVADFSLYPFWQFKLDTSVFAYLDSPKNAAASVSTGYIVMRAVMIVAYAALMVWLLRWVTPTTINAIACGGNHIAALRHKIIGTIGLLLLAVPLVISIRGGVTESTANIGKVYFSPTEYLNHSAINPCFSLLASLSKTDDYASEFNYFPEEERASLFAGLYPPSPTTHHPSPNSHHPSPTTQLLTTTRPNVLLILMESFGGVFTEAGGGSPDITPNYNRYAREGIHFTHCYSSSFRTDRGVLSTLSGHPAFPTLSVMKIPAKSRALPSLAASLNDSGYTSSFLYGGDINFTNMQSYLRTGGYSHIIRDTDFTTEGRQGNKWGVNDHVTFARLLAMTREQTHHPWHIAFLTLSSHEPFEVPYERLDDKFHNAFAYTDSCLGHFLDEFRQTPQWDSTLVVILPDHGYRYPTTITHEQHYRNTMLWTGGAVRQPMTIDRIMNQSDMAATLLAQLHIPHSSYIFSRDVMSAEYSYPFAFFTRIGLAAFADSTGCTVLDLAADHIIENRSADGTAASGSANSSDSTTHRRLQRLKAILQTIYDDLGER